jgi:tetratricopeptide (TPR) repeat protein
MIGVNKSEAKAYSIKGDFLYRDARDNEALAAFTKAIELDATKSQLWEQTLSIQLSLGKYAELVQYGERATSLFPNNPMFYLYYGFGLERSNKTEDAIYQFNIGKELVIENPLLLAQFYSSLGSAYNKIKDHVKSDEAYDKALVFNPNDAFTLNNYAYYLSLRKVKLEKAAIMSKQAVDREPSNPSFLDTYSWILFQQQKYTEALIWIEKTIQYDPKPSGEVLEHYGDILYKNGNVQGAVDKWMAAQEVGGGSDKLINKITSKSLE